MREVAAVAALLLASCYDPAGQCAVDADCPSDQVCSADGLCVAGIRPPPGNPPVAQPDAYAVTVDVPLDVPAASGVLANDSDPGGATLSAVVVAGPRYGQVFLAPDGSFTYAPFPGYAGDGFTYRASNGLLSSAVTSVSLTVAP